MPETDNPSKPSSAADPAPLLQPAELSDSQYHEIADRYLDHALGIFEEIQDQRDELDVEYSVCTFYHQTKSDPANVTSFPLSLVS
jgi:frataxin